MGIEPETSSVNKLSLSNNWIIEPFPFVVTVNHRNLKIHIKTKTSIIMEQDKNNEQKII